MASMNNNMTLEEKKARLKRLAEERAAFDRQYLERQQAEAKDTPSPVKEPEVEKPRKVFPRNTARTLSRSPPRLASRSPPSRLGRGGATPCRTNSRDAKVELGAMRKAYCAQQKMTADLQSVEEKKARLKRLAEERAEADRRYAARRQAR